MAILLTARGAEVAASRHVRCAHAGNQTRQVVEIYVVL